jgi:hypothetical protein
MTFIFKQSAEESIFDHKSLTVWGIEQMYPSQHTVRVSK